MQHLTLGVGELRPRVVVGRIGIRHERVDAVVAAVQRHEHENLRTNRLWIGHGADNSRQVTKPD
jgi:hypothetical protein